MSIAEHMNIKEDVLQAMESSLAYSAYSLNQPFDDDKQQFQSHVGEVHGTGRYRLSRAGAP